MSLITLFAILGLLFMPISGNLDPNVLFREIKSTQVVATSASEVFNARYVWIIQNFAYFTAANSVLWSPGFPVTEARLKFNFFINWLEERGKIFLRLKVSSDSDTAQVSWQGTFNFLDAATGKAKITATFPLQITKKGENSLWLEGISLTQLNRHFPTNGTQKHLAIVFNASFIGRIQDTLQPQLDFIRNSNADYETFSTFGEALQLNKQLCDLVIIVKNKSFCTHKAMLLTRGNNSFHTLLSGSSRTSEGLQKIQIDNIEVDIFEILLNFIYTDKIPEFLTTDNLKKILVAMAKYPFARLENICLEKIADEIRIENSIDWYKFAIKNGVTKLQNYMLEYFRTNAITMGENNWQAVLNGHSDMKCQSGN